jgi:hypothetical protein
LRGSNETPSRPEWGSGWRWHARVEITYVRNHIYLRTDNVTCEVNRPVSGRKTGEVVNPTKAVLVWQAAYWTDAGTPHEGGIDVVLADTHADFEKRNRKEADWWAYHSRRGWEDNKDLPGHNP